jgi:hypothetical protein
MKQKLPTVSPTIALAKPSDLANPLSKYIRRPPVGGTCQISGLNLSAIDKLIRPQECNDFRPPVKTKKLFTKGATRPTVLIDVESLLDYLDSLPNGEGAGADVIHEGRRR